MNTAEKNRMIALWIGPAGYKSILSLEPLDFHASEEASVLILEKLMAEDCHVVIGKTVTVWGPRRYELNQEGTRYTLVENVPDRKAAIADAAIALIQAEKGRK